MRSAMKNDMMQISLDGQGNTRSTVARRRLLAFIADDEARDVNFYASTTSDT